MGKVTVAVRIENLGDLYKVNQGVLLPDQVRSVDVTDALVDTGTTGFLMPKRYITQLGLQPLRVREAQTVGGKVSLPVYRAVRLTIQGRDCISDVSEVSDELPVIVGQVPLELLDWVVDLNGRQLIGNPAHGGEDMIEVF